MSEPFVINVADAPAVRYEGSGTYVAFEDPDDRFPDFGINIHMLPPGEPNGKYHPCWILMVGARRPDRTIHYPVNEKAARHGASVAEPTNDPRTAYADWPSDSEATKLPWPPA